MNYKQYDRMKDSGIEWIGKIPEHWETFKIKLLAQGKDTLFLDGDWIESTDIVYDDNQIRYITTGNIGEGRYKEQGLSYITNETFKRLNCTEVLAGDLIISRLNPPIGRCCIIPDLGNRIVTSVDNVILRPNKNYSKRYLLYAMNNCRYYEYTSLIARGATMQRISRGLLGNIKLPVIPGIEEQRAIASFLDRETSRIDKLIEKKERLIALLKEKRQALITRAVTKGLDPNVKMKDSGVEWIGEIPENWEIWKIGNIFQEVYEQGSDDLPVLSVSIHDGVSDKELDDHERDRKVMRSEDRTKYKKVNVGDLVYNMMRAWQGGFGTVKVVGMVSPAYVVARPLRKIHTEFIEHILRTPKAIEEMRRHSHGVTDFRLRLYWDEFKNMRIPLPSYVEQVDILAEIHKTINQYDIWANKTQITIDLLQERRAALISAAVTGKIDVRDALTPRSPLPEGEGKQ